MNIKHILAYSLLVSCTLMHANPERTEEFINTVAKATAKATIEALAKTKDVTVAESVNNIADAYKTGTIIKVDGMKEAAQNLKLTFANPAVENIRHTHELQFPGNTTIYRSFGCLGALASLCCLGHGIYTAINEYYPKDPTKKPDTLLKSKGFARITAGLLSGLCSFGILHYFGS